MRVKVVSKDVRGGENGAKTWVVWEYSPTHPITKLWRRYLWIGGSWRGKGI